MCDCLTKATDSAMEVAISRNEGGIIKRDLIQVGWPIKNGATGPQTTFTEFEYTFVPMKKDGSLAKPKKKIINLFHSFCPFCGEKHNNN